MSFLASKSLQSLLAKFTDKETLFLNAVFSGNMESAKGLAFELYKKAPQYLLFYFVLTKSDNKVLLLKLMGSVKNLDPNLVYFLLKSEDFSYSELAPFESKVSSSSFIGLCLEKQFFLKKFDTKNKQMKLLDEKDIKDSNLADKKELIDNIPANKDEPMNYSNEVNSMNDLLTKQINQLIDRIDDFTLYDFALRNNIQIDQRDSINFKWYILIKNNDLEMGKEIILSSISFQDIKRVLDHCALKSTGNKIYDILIRYLTGECPKLLLLESFEFLRNDKSFIALKVLLALLISTNDEKLLLLALSLSENDAFDDNYEISLINLFLSRYFLLFSSIDKKFKNLAIKNVQIHNFAYVWSDPMILMNVKLADQVACFKREMTKTIFGIESSLIDVINNGHISVAISSLELKDHLKSSVISKEIHLHKILSIFKSTMFSGILGDKCAFIFDKVIVTDVRITKGQIPTLRTTPEMKITDDIFNNEFMNITDVDLISRIRKTAACFK